MTILLDEFPPYIAAMLPPDCYLLDHRPPYLAAMHPPFQAVDRFIFSEVSFNAAEKVLEAVKMIVSLIHYLDMTAMHPPFLALEGW